MKRLLYLILRKSIIKKLMEKHGDQFTNDVLKTFGLKEMIYIEKGLAVQEDDNSKEPFKFDASKGKRCCNELMYLQTRNLKAPRGVVPVVELIYKCLKCKKELPADLFDLGIKKLDSASSAE